MRRGFNLVELLIVMAIMAILVALLAPGVRSVHSAAMAAQCRHNLRLVWQAQSSRRADLETAQFACGPAWAGQLIPYVDGDQTVFQCPAAESLIGQVGVYGSSGGSSSGDGSTAWQNRVENGVVWPNLEWDIYSGGQFRIRANLNNRTYCRKEPLGPRTWQVRIEDWAWSESCDWDWNDLNFKIHFNENGYAERIDIEKGRTGFYYDMFLDGHMVLQDWKKYYGETYTFEQLSDIIEEGGGRSPYGDATAGYNAALSNAGNYGMSCGAYEIAGSWVNAVDSRVYLVLDYGKSVADYNGDGEDDEFGLFFFTDDDAWLDRYGDDVAAGEGPGDYRALRHDGTANVLFCDGHVESIGLAEEAALDALRSGRYVDPDSPLWRFRR